MFTNSYKLKGRFSIGEEGALAEKLFHDFKWKQLSKLMRNIHSSMFLKFIWEELVLGHQNYKKKKHWISHDGVVRNSDFENQPLLADSTEMLCFWIIIYQNIIPFTSAST